MDLARCNRDNHPSYKFVELPVSKGGVSTHITSVGQVGFANLPRILLISLFSGAMISYDLISPPDLCRMLKPHIGHIYNVRSPV